METTHHTAGHFEDGKFAGDLMGKRKKYEGDGTPHARDGICMVCFSFYLGVSVGFLYQCIFRLIAWVVG